MRWAARAECSVGVCKVGGGQWSDTLDGIALQITLQPTSSSQPWLILAAIVTIYIVLGVLYESFIHPFTILTTLPSAGIGFCYSIRAMCTTLCDIHEHVLRT